jgi:hypothetical protein
MDRKFWEPLELGFLLLAHLVGLVWLIASLLPFPASAQNPIATELPRPAAADLADPAPAKLGTFLVQYPVTKSQAKLLENQSLVRLGEEAFTGYRAFKDKQAGLIAYKARESFSAECVALGGYIERKANRGDIAAHFSMAKQATFNGNDLSVCIGADDLTLGALIASRYTNRYKDSFVYLFVMTQETATEMMMIYHRGMAKELRFQADMVERKINNETHWAAWREQLFPAGARDTPGTIIRCGTSDPL